MAIISTKLTPSLILVTSLGLIILLSLVAAAKQDKQGGGAKATGPSSSKALAGGKEASADDDFEYDDPEPAKPGKASTANKLLKDGSGGAKLAKPNTTIKPKSKSKTKTAAATSTPSSALNSTKKPPLISTTKKTEEANQDDVKTTTTPTTSTATPNSSTTTASSHPTKPPSQFYYQNLKNGLKELIEYLSDAGPSKMKYYKRVDYMMSQLGWIIEQYNIGGWQDSKPAAQVANRNVGQWASSERKEFVRLRRIS